MFGRRIEPILRRLNNSLRLISHEAKSVTKKSQIKSLEPFSKHLDLTWEDNKSGEQLQGSFHYIWLRDHRPESFHPSSGQKLHSSASVLPQDSIPQEIKVNTKTNKLHIVWKSSSCASKKKEEEESVFDLEWLKNNIYCENKKVGETPAKPYSGATKPSLWNRQSLMDSKVHLGINGKDFMEKDSHLLESLEQMHQYGISFLNDVPTDLNQLEKVAIRFGLMIRDTLYGRLWDVISIPDAKNIAYTSLKLNFHQDLLYFEAPPGIQMLHSLKNSVSGGETLFMDGFLAAEILKKEDPKSFDTLTKVNVTFHYKTNGYHYYYNHPTIALDGKNEYLDINYSPQFQGPLCIPFESVESFYNSYAVFSKIIEREELNYGKRLTPGDLVIFNNRRILHARRSFDSHEGERHLRGTYLHFDDFRNRWRSLKFH